MRGKYHPRSLTPLALGVFLAQPWLGGCGNSSSSVFQGGTGDDASVDATAGDGSGGDDGGAVFGGSDSGAGRSCPGQTTCAKQGANCGPIGDGCGHILNCGACSGTQVCGGGGPSVCGAGDGSLTTCTPKACATGQCGPVADGCGGLLNCGACDLPETCGGLSPSQCGTPASCTNLCLKQVTCPNVGTTSVTGTVYAPNGVDPLPNVLVYVPNGTVKPFTPGVSCQNCSAGVTGDPLVSATTGPDGTFTITNMPVGTDIPLVVQTGRWRIQGTIPSVTSCGMTSLPASLTTLPSTHLLGDIPYMAFATGSVDALECVMRKIGVADTEFTLPSGTGRINLYEGDGTVKEQVTRNTTVTYSLGGATVGPGTPSETTLVDDPTTLSQYDMLFFPCQGAEYDRAMAEQTNIIDYANKGGRIFTTHFSYVWLQNTAPTAADQPFQGTADWDVGLCDPNTENNPTGACDPPDQTGYINTSFPKGLTLATWLKDIGASTTLGQIPIGTLKLDICSGTETARGCNAAASENACTAAGGCGIVSPSQLWMNIDDSMIGPWPMHYTFNTPIGTPAASQCGRVLFDDFHVENTGYINCPPGNTDPGCVPASTYDDSYGLTFPSECAAGPMTPQEKLLEYMIFDLGSCVAPDVPVCNKTTCQAQKIGCGPAGDGCGGMIACGNCTAPETCGGGGTPSQCGTPVCTSTNCTSCVPETCMGLGYNCGAAGDGCGGQLDCGTCSLPQTCGGGGIGNVCGGATY